MAMSTTIGFSLLSLAAPGCLNMTFKDYSRKARSRGVYVFSCGGTWVILQLFWLLRPGRRAHFRHDDGRLWPHRWPRAGARQYATDRELGSSRRQPRLDHLQTEHYRVCCPVVSAPGSAPILTTCLPKLPPSNIAIKAAGAFSSPSVISIL